MTRNNNNYYDFYDVTAETIMSVIEVLTSKDGDIKYISDFSGVTKTYARRAINFAINLGLAIKDEQSESYRLSPRAKSLSIKFNQDKQLIFR
jgi:DNA-binding IclR family transcriptional regulator